MAASDVQERTLVARCPGAEPRARHATDELLANAEEWL
jgi:hypothetical protein